MIVIREATPSDSESVTDVDRSATATLRETYRPNQVALAHKHRVSINRIQLVALLGNRVVGTTQYYWKED